MSRRASKLSTPAAMAAGASAIPSTTGSGRRAIQSSPAASSAAAPAAFIAGSVQPGSAAKPESGRKIAAASTLR